MRSALVFYFVFIPLATLVLGCASLALHVFHMSLMVPP